jgi:hypothetical protein
MRFLDKGNRQRVNALLRREPRMVAIAQSLRNMQSLEPTPFLLRAGLLRARLRRNELQVFEIPDVCVSYHLPEEP